MRASVSVAPLTPDPRVSPSARPQLLFALPRVRTRSARQLLSPLARVRCRSTRQLLSHLRQPFRTSSASLFALPRVRYRLIYYPLFRASGIPPIPIRGCALAWRQAPSGAPHSRSARQPFSQLLFALPRQVPPHLPSSVRQFPPTPIRASATISFRASSVTSGTPSPPTRELLSSLPCVRHPRVRCALA